MNSKKYEEMKEKVLTFSQSELDCLFEIVIDEMNARKMEQQANKARFQHR